MAAGKLILSALITAFLSAQTVSTFVTGSTAYSLQRRDRGTGGPVAIGSGSADASGSPTDTTDTSEGPSGPVLYAFTDNVCSGAGQQQPVITDQSSHFANIDSNSFMAVKVPFQIDGGSGNSRIVLASRIPSNEPNGRVNANAIEECQFLIGELMPGDENQCLPTNFAVECALLVDGDSSAWAFPDGA